MEEGFWGSEESREKKKIKEVRFSKKPAIRRQISSVKGEDGSHMGGAIRNPSYRSVRVAKKVVPWTRAINRQALDDEEDIYDHETALYSHFGGRLSGHGAKGDSPRTVRFMHHTLKKYPRALAAYHSGKVNNIPLPPSL